MSKVLDKIGDKLEEYNEGAKEKNGDYAGSSSKRMWSC